MLGSAVIGGLASKAQGGKFGHGFVSAGLGAALGGRIKTGNAYANVLVSAVIGGTVSKLTGGKFANGAQTWAFSAAMAQDWGSAGSSAEARNIEPENITDEVTPDKRFGITTSSDGKTLSGNISIYCTSLPAAACQGVANSMMKINQISEGLTIDLDVTVGSTKYTSDIEVSWVEYNGITNGDSTMAEQFLGLGPLNKIRFKHGVGYGANVNTSTASHELGHAIGLGHQANSTNSLMSYSPNKTYQIKGPQLNNLFEAYR